MKNELRSIKTQLKIFKEKTEEILSLCDTNAMKSHPDETKIKIGLRSRQLLQNETKDSTRDKSEEKYETYLPFDSIASISMEIIYDNLQKIRDLFQKCNSQEKYQRIISKQQLHLNNNNYQNKIIFSNTNLKCIDSLIERLPRLVPEELVKVCKSCLGNFSVCRWKYHCRVCGYVYCFHCSNNYDNFLPFYLDSIRICDDCHKDKKNQVFIS